MSVILITGADGLLGQALMRSDKNPNASYVFLNRHQLDITDYSHIIQQIRAYHPSIIINCAAFTDVEKAETHPADTFNVNGFGPGLLAHACRLHDIWLIHLSTDYVFDGNHAPYKETDTPNPLSVYGKSKLAGEAAIRRITKKFTILRTSWLFDKYTKNFMTHMATLIQEKPHIEVVDTQVGSPTYANDLARTLNTLCAAMNNASCFKGIFHYAGKPSTSRYDWACLIKNTLHQQYPHLRLASIIRVDTWSTLAERPQNSTLDSEKLCRCLGATPSDWQEATRILISKLNTP